MKDKEPRFYLVVRPSLVGTSLPPYCFTFATTEEEARQNVERVWGPDGMLDKRTTVRLVKKTDGLVIATGEYFPAMDGRL